MKQLEALKKDSDYIWDILTLVLCLLLIWALTFSGLTYCIKNFLLTDVIKNTTSPNGKYKAIAFIKNGGAAADYSPQVSILEADEKFGNNHTGNVFIGYGNQFIDTYWESNTTLVVVHTCRAADIFLQENQISDIKIIYKLQPLSPAPESVVF